MKKTLLLVFIHGFKGSDTTFKTFPRDLRNSVAKRLPNVDVVTVQYPQFETRGDLGECVWRFKEWLQNKVIDLEVASHSASPTLEPSVHCVLIGHSMGGIVAAETLLSIVQDEPVPFSPTNTTVSNPHTPTGGAKEDAGFGKLALPELEQRPSSAPPDVKRREMLFPYIRGILSFDTPFLGVNPGVFAFGAEDRWNQAASAYKTFTGATEMLGWGARTPPAEAAAASSRGTTAASANNSKGWGGWSRFAMYSGAAAAIAGATGAALWNWNQISEGIGWVGSHLEFVQCLTRGAELQQRLESLIALTETHDIGFADFYSALGDNVVEQNKYAGVMLGQERTFCVVPKDATSNSPSPPGTRRTSPSPKELAAKPQKTRDGLDDEMNDADQVRDYARDKSKSKGRWVKCVNDTAGDEISGHRTMFIADRNPGYATFLMPQAAAQVVDWVDEDWYGGPIDDMEERDLSDPEGFDLD